MSQEQDKVFFRNYAIVIGVLAVMIVIFLIAARIIGTVENTNTAKRSGEVSEVTKPVGTVAVEGETAAAPVQPAQPVAAVAAADTGADMGKRVYGGLCVSCHGTGLAGIPQLGDKTAWAPRIAQGKDLLYEHALKGFTGKSGMPMLPKGGNTALSDDEVKAAVDYLVTSAQ